MVCLDFKYTFKETEVSYKPFCFQNFCTRNGLPKPVYDEPIISGKPNQWTTRVKVGSLDMIGGASSKKASRLDAIEKMYEKLKVRNKFV